jgi:hypothetical protein
METDKYEKLLQKQLKQQMDKINKISKRKIQLETKKTQEMMDYYAIQHELIDIGWQQKHNKTQLHLLKKHKMNLYKCHNIHNLNEHPYLTFFLLF